MSSLTVRTPSAALLMGSLQRRECEREPHPLTAPLPSLPSLRIPDQPTASANLIGRLNEMSHTGFTSQPGVEQVLSITLFSETHCIKHITFWRVRAVEAKTSSSDPQAWLMQAGDVTEELYSRPLLLCGGKIGPH